MDFKGKENLSPNEISNAMDIRLIPTLQLYKSLRESMSPVNNSSLSSRAKRINQIHKSLDFSLTKCAMFGPKFIKADHAIATNIYPSPPTTRKNKVGNSITIKNRDVSKNIFLDVFPL